MICLLKKLQSWQDGLFIMQHSVMELVVALPAVMHFSPSSPCYLFIFLCAYWLNHDLRFMAVYHVGPNGWTKLSGDDVGELHYKYYPVEAEVVEQEMAELPVT